MPGAPLSFRDPAYDDLDAMVTAKLGLPGGLLSLIRTKGERSNADQVSEDGAKSVYQIIPSTRALALKKWGIDAYLSAENAAEVAGLLLKDSLANNNGSILTAVAEYHGGTDRKNWGPRTKAYVGRVTGAAPPASGSTFDRVKAERVAQQQSTPSIAKVYEAYKAGKLSPEEKADFEADVSSGAVMLPRGAKIAATPGPKAAILPAGVVEAYNNHSEMTDAERNQLDADLKEGLVALPAGVALQRPAPRTTGDLLGMGVRNVMSGAGELADFVATPIRAPMNAAA